MIRTITWKAKKPTYNSLLSPDEFTGWEVSEHPTRQEARKAAGKYKLSQVRIKYKEARIK